MKILNDGMIASQLIKVQFDSKVLAGNPLGDSTTRDLFVYLPPEFREENTYPALLGIVGFTGTGGMLFNLDPFSEDLKTRLDRLIHEKKLPPVIVVAPDCFNRLGGSQYINSSAIGNYEDYLVKEIIPFINSRYKILRWGVFGKSSGGFGSMTLAMHYPELFTAAACHSGDSTFELCYLPDFPKALNAFHKAGGPSQWLKKFWGDVNHKRGEYHAPLNALAMSAHYSPNPKSEHLGIDFPYCLKTGIFKPEVWERWKKWDPVNRIEEKANALKKLRCLYIDCGSRDEFGLQWGARAMNTKLKNLEIKHHYEEFEDGHMSITYRYDVSLPVLGNALV